MAYHGYIPAVTNYCKLIQNETGKKVRILEIGVDTGLSLFALHSNLSLLGVEYEYTGVDIKIQDHVKIIAEDYMFFKLANTEIKLKEENSLTYLERLVENNPEKFDVILIDGDHNYFTVSRECKFIAELIHKNTMMIFDDHTGKYENEDMFYSEEQGYHDNELATKKQDSEKAGVKLAIDEFLEENNQLTGFKLYREEPPLVVVDRSNSILSKDLLDFVDEE